MIYHIIKNHQKCTEVLLTGSWCSMADVSINED